MVTNFKALGNVAPLFLGALSFGTFSSYPSPAIMSLMEENPQLGEERFSNLISWFSNAPRLSAAIGPFLIICILPRLGRKITLSIVSFIFGLSWFLLYLINLKDSYNDVSFNIINGIIVRTIMGFFLGILACLTITYIIELAQPKCFGVFGSLYQLFIIMGICLNNILGAFVNWKILLIICAIINILFGFFLLLKHDSPVSLKLQKHKVRTKSCCSSFSCIIFDKKAKSYGLNKSYIKLVISSMVMFFFQQYGGINAILNKLSSIMALSGLDINPNLQSALATLAQFVACLIASFLMDSIGARILWIVSSIGCLLSLVVYAYCIYNTESLMNVPKFIPVLSVFVYCLFFGLGQGPAPWVVFPGNFPDFLRYEGIAMMMFSHWFISFVVCYTHPIIIEKIGEFYAILIYVICLVGSLFYGIFCIPKKESEYKEDFAMF